MTKSKRLGNITTFEAVWLRVLRESRLDLTKPFTAKQAYAEMCNGKNRQGQPLRQVPPSWARVFALLKKSEEFNQIRDSSGNSTWVASE